MNTVLPVLKGLRRSFIFVVLVAATLGWDMPSANAQVINDIEITQAGDEAEIQLRFITQIRYVRNEVLKNGDIRIYVTLLNIDPKDPRLTWARQKSPPSDLVFPFTVTYPELDTSLTLSFGKSVKFRVSAGHDGRSVSIFTPSIKPKPKSPEATKGAAPSVAVPIAVAPVIAPPVGSGAPDSSSLTSRLPTDRVPTPQEVELEAQRLFIAASDAVQAGQVDRSIEILNKLLALPPNALSQAGQRLMGEAREKNGEYSKARAEYELYLKLYPKAEDAQQVKVLLAKLPKDDAVKKPAEVTEAQASGAEPLRVNAGISQTFYSGFTHSDTFATDGINPPTTSTIDSTDQSMLLTTLDMTTWKRTENLDTRFVLREFNKLNFLSKTTNDYRWDAMYVEQSARNRKFMYRMGRQSGTTAGMPGRFDGVAGGYSLNETWRINAAAGLPVEYYGNDLYDRRVFTSLGFDLTRMPDEWSGSAYALLQKMGSVNDRAAIGLEAHYFIPQRNYMLQTEYDVLFKKINFATFQGNWTRPSGDNYYMIFDHRRSPPLALNLQGQTTLSVDNLLSSGSINLKTLRDNAVALGMISNMATAGVSHPFTPDVRVVTDFRLTNTGGTGEYYSTLTSTTQPGTPGSGNQYALSVQVIGNNLIFQNDVGIANAILTKTETTTGQSLIFTQVETFQTRWRIDMSLFLFKQNSTLDTHQTQIRPSLTVNYRLNDSWNFTAEGGIEQNKTTSTNASDTTRRHYYYMGYRWDFR